MALLVQIGCKFKIYHVSTYPDIRPLKDFPEIMAEDIPKDGQTHQLHSRYDRERRLWVKAGLWNEELRNQLEWEEIDAILPSAKTLRNRKRKRPGHIAPLNVLDEKHRPRIEMAFDWCQALADSKGFPESHSSNCLSADRDLGVVGQTEVCNVGGIGAAENSKGPRMPWPSRPRVNIRRVLTLDRLLGAVARVLKSTLVILSCV